MHQISNSLQKKAVYFESLDYVRAIAIILVFYCHNFAALLQARGLEKGLVSFIRSYFLIPLGIIQDFGFLAVALFFLLSGFLITYKGTKENLKAFIIKRVFRIYPAWMVAILIMQLVNLLVDYQLVLSPDKVLNFSELLKCLTLWGYVETEPIWIIGVGWTLIIEIIFYFLFACAKVVSNNVLWKLILFNICFVALCLIIDITIGKSFIGFNHWIPYIPCLIFGQLIYAFYTNENKTVYIIFSLLNYCILILASQIIPESELNITDNSYLISLFYAAIIFILLLKIKVKCSPMIRYIALISYSIYIYHGNIGQIVTLWFPDNLFLLGFLCSTIITLLIAAISYELIEKKGQNIARTIIKNHKLL